MSNSGGRKAKGFDGMEELRLPRGAFLFRRAAMAEKRQDNTAQKTQSSVNVQSCLGMQVDTSPSSA